MVLAGSPAGAASQSGHPLQTSLAAGTSVCLSPSAVCLLHPHVGGKCLVLLGVGDTPGGGGCLTPYVVYVCELYVWDVLIPVSLRGPT
jgi:hypothetical protein